MSEDPFAALADCRRWVWWRAEARGASGKPTKVPYATDGRRADSTDPATWATRGEAEAAARRFLNGANGGTGIVLGSLGGGRFLAGLDLDSSVTDGLIADWAAELLAAVPSYGEISPSGAGLKTFFLLAAEQVRPLLGRLGVPPDGWGLKRGIPGLPGANHGAGVELYLSARFFTITGQHWARTPQVIRLLDAADTGELVRLIPPAAGAMPGRAAGGRQPGIGRDNSRSAIAWRRALRLIRSGCAKDDLIAALKADPDTQQWASEVDARQFDRLWQRGQAAIGAVGPVIRVRPGERHLAADDGLAAVDASGAELFVRGARLVRLGLTAAKTADGGDVMAPAVIALNEVALVRALALAARWERFDARADEWRRVDPPKPVAEQILEMQSDWPFAPLTGILTCPGMRPDGSLLTEPGYDPATGYYLTSELRLPPIPARPSRADALAALAILDDELLSEFPFADAPSKSVARSQIVTPVVRAAIGPCVPAHATTAPAPGTGKSFLADLAAAVATGKRAPVAAQDKSLEETEKRLIAKLLAGVPIISLDNIREATGSAVLCQAIERPLLSLRPLGSSSDVEIPNTVTVFMNGNNLTTVADLVRRVLVCHLDANSEAPEERVFQDDPLARILADRGRYVAAALVIVRAYIAAGMPDRLAPLPSFGAWSDRVRSALVWLDCADPVATIGAAHDDDPQRQLRAELFDDWETAIGAGIYLRPTEAIAEAEKADMPGSRVRAELRAVFARAAVAGDRHGGISPDRLGRWLARNTDTIAGHRKLTADRSAKTRPRWAVVQV